MLVTVLNAGDAAFYKTESPCPHGDYIPGDKQFKMKRSKLYNVLDGAKCYGGPPTAWKRECRGKGCGVGVVL